MPGFHVKRSNELVHLFRVRLFWQGIAKKRRLLSPCARPVSTWFHDITHPKSPLSAQRCVTTPPTMCHDIVPHKTRCDQSTAADQVETGRRRNWLFRWTASCDYTGLDQPLRQQDSPGNTGNRMSAGTLPGRLGRAQKRNDVLTHYIPVPSSFGTQAGIPFVAGVPA